MIRKEERQRERENDKPCLATWEREQQTDGTGESDHRVDDKQTSIKDERPQRSSNSKNAN